MAFVLSCSAILGLTDPRVDESAAASDAMADTMISGDAVVMGDGGDARSCGEPTTGTNCGRCGHSCLGGECLAGQCQPITLATMQGRPFQLAVSGDAVYWTNNFSDEIMRADKVDGGATVFASGADVSSPWGIVVDATSVYWTNHAFAATAGGIRSCPLAGCPGGVPVTLSTNPGVIDVAVDARNIYFTMDTPFAVLQASKLDGGGLLEFPTSNSPFHVAVDPNNLYWTNSGNNVLGLPIDGGALLTLGALLGDRAGGITTDSTGIYWGVEFNAGSGSVNKSTATDGAILKSYGMKNPNPVNIVVDATRIYWTNLGTVIGAMDMMTSDGSVLSCPRDGCDKGEGLKTLAGSQHNALGLAQDNDAVYWTTNPPGNGGTIMKVAKP